MPFEDKIDWRSRTVWLDHTEVDSIGDRLMSAHPEVLVDPERSPRLAPPTMGGAADRAGLLTACLRRYGGCSDVRPSASARWAPSVGRDRSASELPRRRGPPARP